ALARLEERGHVRALPGEDRRRPYEITAAGSALLTQRAEAMRSFAARGLAQLHTAQACPGSPGRPCAHTRRRFAVATDKSWRRSWRICRPRRKRPLTSFSAPRAPGSGHRFT